MEKIGNNVVVIGGGTGSFTLLSSLKFYAPTITSLVTMSDDGSSTGTLRDELGVLPPGDVRQCLVALSKTPKMRDLFNYRFETGTFKGHAFGNIFLAALEKTTGSFAEAVETASDILRVQGRVVPVTLDNVRLVMEWPDQSVVINGEGVIDVEKFEHDPRQAVLRLNPRGKANPSAIEAIEAADLIVITPGDLYTSLGPLLVVDGIGEALKQTKAKIAYVCNLVMKPGHTDGFTVCDHVAEIERFAGGPILDYVLYNDGTPDAELAKHYDAEHAFLVPYDCAELNTQHYKAIGSNFLAGLANRKAGDTQKRSLIRHNAKAVAQALLKLNIAQ